MNRPWWDLVNKSAQYLLFFQGILLGSALTILAYAVLNDGAGSPLAAGLAAMFAVIASIRGMAERRGRGEAQSTPD